MEFERREIHFSGRVQGVGFRYTTQRIASKHEVGGNVKNLPDGRVRLILEGPRSEMESLISELKQTMDSNIEDVEVKREVYQNEFDGFRIIR